MLSKILPLLAAGIVVALFYWKADFELITYQILVACGIVLIFLAVFMRLSWFYYSLVLLIPLSLDRGFLGGAKLSFPSEAMLLLMIPVCLIFNQDFRKRTNEACKSPLTILLIADLLLLLLFSLFSTHVDVSLKRVLIRGLFFFGFFLMIFLFDDPKKLVWPWIIYALGLIPVMYYSIRNHIHFDFDPRVVFDICAPFYNDHTIYGACLAFIIPGLFLILLRAKLFNLKGLLLSFLWLTLGVLILSLMLALSRAALLSILAALFFTVLLSFKVRFPQLLMGLGILAVVAWTLQDQIYDSIEKNEAVSNDGELINHFSSVTNLKTDASNLERVNRWICAYRMFESRPFTGFGPGTYQFEYNRFQSLENKTYISTTSGDRGNAHSEYLTYLSETGIVGFIGFISIVLYSLYLGMKNHYMVKDEVLKTINLVALLGLVTFYFHGIFNSFIDQSKMAFLVFTALATLVWIQSRATKKREG